MVLMGQRVAGPVARLQYNPLVRGPGLPVGTLRYPGGARRYRGEHRVGCIVRDDSLCGSLRLRRLHGDRSEGPLAVRERWGTLWDRRGDLQCAAARTEGARGKRELYGWREGRREGSDALMEEGGKGSWEMYKRKGGTAVLLAETHGTQEMYDGSGDSSELLGGGNSTQEMYDRSGDSIVLLAGTHGTQEM